MVSILNTKKKKSGQFAFSIVIIYNEVEIFKSV